MKRHIETQRSLVGISTWYFVQGDKGAVQFMIMDSRYAARVFNLGIHSLKPQYPDHESLGKCRWLDNHICYFTTSGLAGQDIYDKFSANEDPEYLWQLLEECYVSNFG